MTVARPFDKARFEELLRERSLRLGSPATVRDLTTSTSDDAWLAARAGAPHGALFVADEQSAGRGRRGNRWLAPPKQNLMFSFLLRPDWTPAQCQGLSLAVGLAVRQVVQAAIKGPVQIKWPNDVLAHTKKIAGILVETQLSGPVVRTVVIGIGLNVSCTDFPQAIRNSATSLSLLGGEQLEREIILADLLAALEARLEAFADQGLTSVLNELAQYDALSGRRITIDDLQGIACGIDQRGALLVKDDSGHMHAFSAGHVVVVS